jgi:nucleoside-diphosphate-sugar epimerase
LYVENHASLGLGSRKVLVTGGCGFIGINLTTALLERGATVTVLDLPTADWDRLPPDVTRVEADLLEPSTLTGALADIVVVYHLAARTDLDGTTVEDYRVNFEGTKNLLDEAATSGSVQRFVFYSTMLTVGVADTTRFLDETTPYRPDTLYGESKVAGEKVVIAECARTGIPYTIIRPTSVYGPWGGAPYDSFFRTVKSRSYVHAGKAENLVSWVYVKNLVDLTLTASTRKEAKNEIYFGSDLHPYTMREITDRVADYYGVRILTVPSFVLVLAAYAFGVLKVLGLNVPIYPARLRNIRANYCFSIEKAIRLGHVQRYDLNHGIKESLDWYESHGRLA